MPISPLARLAAPSGRESIAATINTIALKWNSDDNTHAEAQRFEPATAGGEALDIETPKADGRVKH